jgi:hypothetical protein
MENLEDYIPASGTRWRNSLSTAISRNRGTTSTNEQIQKIDKK